VTNGIVGIKAVVGPPSAQDLDDESSFPTADEPNSNSSQYSKNHESDPGSPIYHSQLDGQGIIDFDGGNAMSAELPPNYCSKDRELEVYEPEAKRLKVD